MAQPDLFAVRYISREEAKARSEFDAEPIDGVLVNYGAERSITRLYADQAKRGRSDRVYAALDVDAGAWDDRWEREVENMHAHDIDLSRWIDSRV